ncbi:DUF1127 domain-containing protein [Azospirillum halopraeferens]|uniref:DUF1127 domain-containing protein n=1 Tax=Azospirillum halopraeferens TaxID=34010 RepID=UPI0005586D17|nr:DUF1127 domain-containing protein [Azospirillum halopraeferens]
MSTAHARERPAGPPQRSRHWLARWLDRPRMWRERSAYRRALARMDAHLLADIGLDETTARAEAAKPFWKA